jgi:hypothetical protein
MLQVHALHSRLLLSEYEVLNVNFAASPACHLYARVATSHFIFHKPLGNRNLHKRFPFYGKSSMAMPADGQWDDDMAGPRNRWEP